MRSQEQADKEAPRGKRHITREFVKLLGGCTHKNVAFDLHMEPVRATCTAIEVTLGPTAWRLLPTSAIGQKKAAHREHRSANENTA